jgi:hypothetical protein
MNFELEPSEVKIGARPYPRTSPRARCIVCREIDFETIEEDLQWNQTSAVFPLRLTLLLYTDQQPLTPRIYAALSLSTYLQSIHEAHTALGLKHLEQPPF